MENKMFLTGRELLNICRRLGNPRARRVKMKKETILTDEQVRNIIEDVAWANEEVFKFAVEVARAIEQDVLTKLAEQATESYPCRIVETDFETDTVTLEMQGKYTVSSGQKYLCDVPLYRCPVPHCKGKLGNSTGIAAPDGWQLVPKEPTEEMLVDAMEASLLGRPSADDDSYVRSIVKAWCAAAPKFGEEK